MIDPSDYNNVTDAGLKEQPLHPDGKTSQSKDSNSKLRSTARKKDPPLRRRVFSSSHPHHPLTA